MTGVRIVDMWGSARGPASRLSPQGRIVAGLLLLTADLVLDPATWPGVALWAAILLCWSLVALPPAHLRIPLLLLALVLLGPWFLLVPWIDAPGGCARPGFLWPGGAWAVAWRIFARGLGGLLIGVWTAATLSLPDLGRAMVALPVPRALATLLLQIVHQSHALVAETRGMLQAIRVRGGTTGLRSVPTLAAALSGAWMPRVVRRAERVAEAMEVRGFHSASLGMDSVRWRGADVAGAGLAAAALCAAACFRWGLPSWGLS